MKHSLPIAVALSMALGLAVNTASAADGTITFAGTVNSNTCTVEAGESYATGATDDANPTIDLPEVAVSAFGGAANAAGPFQPFHIHVGGAVANCPAGNVRVFLDPNGNAIAGSPTYLKNTTAVDGTNAALRILVGKTGTTAVDFTDPLGSQTATPLTGTTTTAVDIPFRAQWMSTAAVTTEGEFETTVNYTVVYN